MASTELAGRKYDRCDMLMAVGIISFAWGGIVLIAPSIGMLFLEFSIGLLLIGIASVARLRRKKAGFAGPAKRPVAEPAATPNVSPTAVVAEGISDRILVRTVEDTPMETQSTPKSVPSKGVTTNDRLDGSDFLGAAAIVCVYLAIADKLEKAGWHRGLTGTMLLLLLALSVTIGRNFREYRKRRTEVGTPNADPLSTQRNADGPLPAKNERHAPAADPWWKDHMPGKSEARDESQPKGTEC